MHLFCFVLLVRYFCCSSSFVCLPKQWLAHGIAENDQRKTLLQILASDQIGSADDEIQIQSSVTVRTQAMDAPPAGAAAASGAAMKKAKAKGKSARRKRTLDQMSGTGGLLYGEHANSAKAAMEMQRKMKRKRRDAKKVKDKMLFGK